MGDPFVRAVVGFVVVAAFLSLAADLFCAYDDMMARIERLERAARGDDEHGD